MNTDRKLKITFCVLLVASASASVSAYYFWLSKLHMRFLRDARYSPLQHIDGQTVNISSNLINPHDYRYIIFADGVCKAEDVHLLVVVCSATGNFQERQTIRETWGSDVKNVSLRAKLIFILGKALILEEGIELIRENNINNDIIQENFVDTYKNLSLKSVAMLKWASTYCPQAEYLLKADDDMYINLPNLIQDVRNTWKRRFIMGVVLNFAKPDLDKDSKWYEPNYKNKFYPKFVRGSSYLISGDVISDLYQASLEVPLFWLEDIYITGILAEKVFIDRINNRKYASSKRSSTGCDNKDTISSHGHTVGDIRHIWNVLHDSKIKC